MLHLLQVQFFYLYLVDIEEVVWADVRSDGVCPQKGDDSQVFSLPLQCNSLALSDFVLGKRKCQIRYQSRVSMNC